MLLHGLRYRGVALFLVHLPVEAEEHAVRRVYKGVAQIVRQQARGEVLPARHKLVHAHVLRQARPQRAEGGLHIVFNPKLVSYPLEARLYAVHYIVAGHAVFQMRVAQIQKIRQLVVVRAALARGGRYHYPPRGVGLHYGLHLSELLRPRNGRAAEFHCFQHFLPFSHAISAKNTAAPAFLMRFANACISRTLISFVITRAAPSSTLALSAGSSCAYISGRRT